MTDTTDSPLRFSYYDKRGEYYRHDFRAIPDRVLYEFTSSQTGNTLLAGFIGGVTDYRLLLQPDNEQGGETPCPIDLYTHQEYHYSLEQMSESPTAALLRGIAIGDPFLVQYATNHDPSCVHSLNLPAIITIRRQIFPTLFSPYSDDPIDELHSTLGNLLASEWIHYTVNSLL